MHTAINLIFVLEYVVVTLDSRNYEINKQEANE